MSYGHFLNIYRKLQTQQAANYYVLAIKAHAENMAEERLKGAAMSLRRRCVLAYGKCEAPQAPRHAAIGM